MYTALATGSYDEEALAAAEAAYLQSQQQKQQQPPTSNGSEAPTVKQQPPEPQQQQQAQQEKEEPVAHRWLVVGAMCACMVLANFDKVRILYNMLAVFVGQLTGHRKCYLLPTFLVGDGDRSVSHHL